MLAKLTLAASVGALLLLPATAFADAAGELATTITHAGFAAGASDIDTVHMHLHHALNCMVGPNGVGFDATNANPCAGAGKGLLPDTADAQERNRLDNVVMILKAGLVTDNLALAKDDANNASLALKTFQ